MNTEEKKAYFKAYYQANKEKLKADSKAYKEEHKNPNPKPKGRPPTRMETVLTLDPVKTEDFRSPTFGQYHDGGKAQGDVKGQKKRYTERQKTRVVQCVCGKTFNPTQTNVNNHKNTCPTRQGIPHHLPLTYRPDTLSSALTS